MYKQKPTEQHEPGEVPHISADPRAEFRTYDGKEYPSCKIHGALLRYEHDIWRCVECGFAVTWVRYRKVKRDGMIFIDTGYITPGRPEIPHVHSSKDEPVHINIPRPFIELARKDLENSHNNRIKRSISKLRRK